LILNQNGNCNNNYIFTFKGHKKSKKKCFQYIFVFNDINFDTNRYIKFCLTFDKHWSSIDCRMPDVATIISCTSAVALGQLVLNMIFILRSSINISISDSTGAAMSGLLLFPQHFLILVLVWPRFDSVLQAACALNEFLSCHLQLFDFISKTSEGTAFRGCLAWPGCWFWRQPYYHRWPKMCTLNVAYALR